MPNLPVKRISIRKRDVIIVAVIVSIILYLSGVFTGINANKIIEKKVNTEMEDLKQMMDNSALDLKNLLLQQLYIDNFETQDKCEFMDIYLSRLYSQLNYYWDVLPFRLEEYDKKGQSNPDYLTLKREYIRLSLRFWLISVNNYRDCRNHKFIPLLYFYTGDCEKCVNQGEEFDKLAGEMKLSNRTVLVFPIDANFQEDTVFLLKQYFNISSYPATVVNGQLLQTGVISSEELKSRLKLES